jgi:hypothetical protein
MERRPSLARRQLQAERVLDADAAIVDRVAQVLGQHALAAERASGFEDGGISGSGRLARVACT